MVEFKIDTDKREVKLKLNRLVKKTPKLSRRILGRLSEAIIAESIKNYLSGNPLHRQTGTLAKSLNFRFLNDWKTQIGTNLVYAAIHEFGGEINAKGDGYLHFKIDDEWVMVKKVKMPPRPWLAPALQDVFGTNKGQLIVDKTMKEWLGREWKK